SQLIRFACRAIATKDLERMLGHMVIRDGLEDLQTQWAADAEEPLLLYALRGERAGVQTLMTTMTAGDVDMKAMSEVGVNYGKDVFSRFGWWLYRGRLPADHASLIRYFNDAIRAAKLPPHEIADAIAAIPKPPDDRDHRITNIFLPAVTKVSDASLR